LAIGRFVLRAKKKKKKKKGTEKKRLPQPINFPSRGGQVSGGPKSFIVQEEWLP